MAWNGRIEKIDANRWRIDRDYLPGMNADAIIYSNDNLIKHVLEDNSPQQAANVACMPGIVGNSMAMPDIHWGYGFPIGGVAAVDAYLSYGNVDFFSKQANVDLAARYGYTAAELRRQLVRRDLPSYIDRDRLYSFAKQVLDLSRQGLLERGLGEEKYLEPLYDRVNNRTNPANTMLAQLENGADIYDVVRSYAKIG